VQSTASTLPEVLHAQISQLESRLGVMRAALAAKDAAANEAAVAAAGALGPTRRPHSRDFNASAPAAGGSRGGGSDRRFVDDDTRFPLPSLPRQRQQQRLSDDGAAAPRQLVVLGDDGNRYVVEEGTDGYVDDETGEFVFFSVDEEDDEATGGAGEWEGEEGAGSQRGGSVQGSEAAHHRAAGSGRRGHGHAPAPGAAGQATKGVGGRPGVLSKMGQSLRSVFGLGGTVKQGQVRAPPAGRVGPYSGRDAGGDDGYGSSGGAGAMPYDSAGPEGGAGFRGMDPETHLAGPDDASDVVLKGYLAKCGSRGAFWHTRYCVLTTEQLIYYASREDHERERQSMQRAGGGFARTDASASAVLTRKGAVELAGSHPHVGPGDIGGAPSPFVFRVDTGRRVFAFAASSEAAVLNWVGALCAVTEANMRAVLAEGGPQFASMADLALGGDGALPYSAGAAPYGEEEEEGEGEEDAAYGGHDGERDGRPRGGYDSGRTGGGVAQQPASSGRSGPQRHQMPPTRGQAQRPRPSAFDTGFYAPGGLLPH
jgi:hypothetical protein